MNGKPFVVLCFLKKEVIVIVSGDILTLSDIQEIFHISKPTALRLIHSDGFPKLTGVGKRLLIPRDALKQWCIDNTSTESLKNLQQEFIQIKQK